MRFLKSIILPVFIISCLTFQNSFSQDDKTIPLPEHPRPDFMRQNWINLNGLWNFRFDKQNVGETEKWFNNSQSFDKKILVPFPWGSKLSGISNEADIAWYSRTLNIPVDWEGKKVYVIIGACDWTTSVWLDGNLLGTYRGGYTPFEFDMTAYVRFGKDQQLVFRVDDTPHSYKLEGKQGYGQAKGIWQTVYVESRSNLSVEYVHFTPDIDNSKVKVEAVLNDIPPKDAAFQIQFKPVQMSSSLPVKFPKGSKKVNFEIPVANQHLWSLDDPYLYEADAVLSIKGKEEDRVSTYFGMRKINVVSFPVTGAPYIALNNKPLYLQLCLDQSYHPDGFYTFPSDEFMRDEIIRSKKIGLNGNRIHIKVEVPRKLYWADKLGLLIMADVPNFWGEPTDTARNEWNVAMRGMIKRDYNHPAIFSWVMFNETWGLQTKTSDNKREYLPETQSWVESCYRLAKSLDPSRLVEDNSACNYDHTVTDINSWHSYRPGYDWKKFLDDAEKNTYPGSAWNFIGGRKQGNEPMMNSECGNVWGYTGSAGDVDWSWDYHIMMNELRSHPKVCGWLYTEHHDVINEWNGYYKFDRTDKVTGLSEIVPGMSLNDLHSKVYISTGSELCRDVKPGESVEVPVFVSYMTDEIPSDGLILKTELYGWNQLGIFQHYNSSEQTLPSDPYLNKELSPLRVTMPENPGLVILSLSAESLSGKVFHKNFTTFFVNNGTSPRVENMTSGGRQLKIVRFAPETFSDAKWTRKQWNVLDGKKVNGAGSGYFEYRVALPADFDPSGIAEATLIFEASAKKLNGKDMDEKNKMEGDYMLGKGAHDPSQNPNSYPMTDTYKYPSKVNVQADGKAIGEVYLEDDPADHRGILSWHSQLKNKKLNEAGTFGYLCSFNIPVELLKNLKSKEIVIRFSVDDSLPGGLAIYGERFGRYPVDPSLVFVMKK
ncbi:MAG: glycoside hydrolase family 2 [Bacteroidales bacterium]|nr:glycoside hydrolase family 2 [Bacteroidales bacterium]